MLNSAEMCTSVLAVGPVFGGLQIRVPLRTRKAQGIILEL